MKSSIFSCREGRRQEDERARKAGKVRLIMAVVSSLAEGPQCGCPESFLWDVQFQVVI